MSSNVEITVNLSNLISQINKNLEKMREQLDVIKQNKEQQKSFKDFKPVFQEEMHRLKCIKSQQRELYIGLEKDRNLIAVEKEKIDKNSHGLDQVRSLKIWQDIEKSDDIVKDHDDIIVKLSDEWKQRKSLFEKKQELALQKNTMIEQHEQKTKIFNEELPPRILKLSENLKDLCDLLKFKQIKNPTQIQNSRELPTCLFNVYNKFNIEVKKEDQIDIVINSIKKIPINQDQKKYEIHQSELHLTLQQPYFEAKMFDKLKIIGFGQEQLSSVFPLKFIINYMTELNILIISLDLNKKNNFEIEELLSGIIAGDNGTSLFPNAKTELERNFNNKYQYYNWLQILGNNPIAQFQQINQHITAKQIMDKIKERAINKVIIRFIIDYLKLNKWFIEPLITKSEQYKEINQKNYRIINLKKIEYSEYCSSLRLPHWYNQIKKPDLLEEEIKEENPFSQINLTQTTQYNMIQKYIFSRKETQSLLGTELGDVKDCSQNDKEFYKMQLEAYSNLKLNCLILIDSDYPNRLSQFTLLDCSGENPQLVSNKGTIFRFPADKVKHKSKEQDKSQGARWLDDIQMHEIQKQINSQIIESFMNQDSKYFSIQIQINRLITLIEQYIELNNKKATPKSRCFLIKKYDIL